MGFFSDTTTGLENEVFAFGHIDGDQYRTTLDSLTFFYPKLAPGGIVLFGDYLWEGCLGVDKALREFFCDKAEVITSPHKFQAMIVKAIS